MYLIYNNGAYIVINWLSGGISNTWGCNFMAETKRIMISLPDSLLEEVDFMVSTEKKNRSEFIREAMRLYIREKRHMDFCEKMKNGYKEMSQINISLSEMGLEQDVTELYRYEAKLTGCEKL